MIGNPEYPTYQVFLAVGLAAAVTGLLMPLFIVVFPLGIAVLILYYPRRHRLPYDAI